MIVPMSLFSKVTSMQGIVSIPLVIIMSAATDKIRLRIGTIQTRRGAHLIFTLSTIILFLPTLFSPCAQVQNIILIGKTSLKNFGQNCEGFSFCGIGMIMACSTKPVPNEIGGAYAGHVYAFANTVSNIGNFIGKKFLEASL